MALPDEVGQAILAFVRAKLFAARVARDAELAELKTSTESISAESKHNAKTVVAQTEQVAQLAAEKAAAEGKAEQLAADLVGAQADAARERQAAEDIRLELAKASLRLEAVPRLEADLMAMRAELGTERQARSAAEQRAAVLGAEKASLESRLDDARQDARDQLANAKEDAERLRAQLATAQAGAATERQAAEITRIELAKAAQQAAVLAAQKADLEGRLGDAKQDVERHREQFATAQASAELLVRSLNDRVEDLLAQIEGAKQEVDHARAAAKAASEEAAMLRDKLAQKIRTDAHGGEATNGRDGDGT
jgi:chromosome segregation ATPase